MCELLKFFMNIYHDRSSRVCTTRGETSLKGQRFQICTFCHLIITEGQFLGYPKKNLPCGQVCFLTQDDQCCYLELRHDTDREEGQVERQTRSDPVALEEAVQLLTSVAQSWLCLGSGQQTTGHSYHLVFLGQTRTAAFGPLAKTGKWGMLEGMLVSCRRQRTTLAVLPGAQFSEDPPVLSQK